MPGRRIEFSESASQEYDDAFDWYLARSPDAALRFDLEVNRALEQISSEPERWARGSHDTRRFLLRRFPFVVIYRELPEGTIQVVAISHTSRKPGYWKNRI